MNYQKIYEQIILNAQSQSRIKLNKQDPNYVYYERHHIVPRALGGSDDPYNLVLLTAKEHFVAHKLLIKIYPGRESSTAFWYMCIGNKKQKDRITNVSSRDYVYARELAFFANSGENSASFGKIVSKETRKKISESQKGKKRSHKFKERVSVGMRGVNKGKKLSKEHKEKLSEAKKGNKNPNKNGLSKEHIEKIRNSNKGLKRSNVTRANISKAKKGIIAWNKTSINTEKKIIFMLKNNISVKEISKKLEVGSSVIYRLKSEYSIKTKKTQIIESF